MRSCFSLIRTQFSDSLRALSRTRTITTAGLLLAIQMVLSSYGVIEVTDSLKISLAHLAIAPTAILFGPVVAGLQGALSDLLGFMLKPSGPYFPGFTLTAALLGVIYGIPGIVTVALLLLVALRDAARACRVSTENHFRTPAMGAACGLFTLTVLAPYVNVLAARSMLLLAVMALGIMTAARRAGRTEEAVLSMNMSDDARESASVTVRLGRAEH